MEIIKGHTLFKHLITLKKCLPTNIHDIIKDKIKKLNELGIAHSDLNKGNVMLKIDDQGNPIDAYIIDFGLSNTGYEEYKQVFYALDKSKSDKELLKFICKV